jgi:hypothetical protein
MRRTLLAMATAVALGAGALTAAPAANAGACWDPVPCADPTPVSVAASPSTATIGTAGSQAIALTAVFDDPDDTMDGVDFTIALPDGNTRSAWANGYLSKVGARKTFRATYTAYTFYAPGSYRVTAVANRASKVQSYSGTPQATGSFTVKHKVTSTIYASKMFFKRGEKLRFNGSVRNTTDASGLKVSLRFKAKGKKKFKKVGKAVTTNAAGEWKSKKVRMTKQGKWFAKIGGKGYVVGTKTPTLKSKFR